ncbi:hypothetical protein KIL84_001129 [Mauremys mutica]|uniref:Uncharacterized protein n=1 Tax=Mauremys mutica TaxID=74926 RepID=A0A9D4ATT6_9SAUR|nr:hypothetical protein KIL84_001129 [Mauremys mutica]
MSALGFHLLNRHRNHARISAKQTGLHILQKLKTGYTVSNQSQKIDRFVHLLIKCIPHTYRRVYISCWQLETEALFKEYEKSGDPDTEKAGIESLNSARLKRLNETVEDLDFTHFRCKALAFLHKLGAADLMKQHQLKISASCVATHLLCKSKIKTDKLTRQKIEERAIFKCLTQPYHFAAIISLYCRRNKQGSHCLQKRKSCWQGWHLS